MNIFNLNRHAVAALRLSALALLLAPALVHATITITGAPSVVTYDVENYPVAGTSTAGISGDMQVSNASLGGAAITFSRSGLAFATPAVNLALGHNYITVYGSDGGGVIYSNTVNIWRYTIDGGANTAGSEYGRRWHGSLVGWGWNDCPAGHDYVTIAAGHAHLLALRFGPVIDITNASHAVRHDVTHCTIGGTNSPPLDADNTILGTMWWRNTANDSTGSFSAAQAWRAENIPLSVGTNTMCVSGTNVVGLTFTDWVDIYRKTWAESSPQIATNALVFPACESVLLAGPLTSVVWRSEAIWDYVDNTTVMIAQISVHPSNDVNSVIVVTNNVSNVCGRVDWDVPDALVREQEVYVMRFDVVNSSMLTNSMVFSDNPFTVIPEPYTAVLLLLAVLRGVYARKKHVSN